MAQSESLLDLSPSEEHLVLLALTTLKEMTQFFLYDNLQMQNIYDAGALSALHYILRRKDDINNFEIITLGCQIVANVMQSLNYTTQNTNLSQGDFMDALVELIEYAFCALLSAIYLNRKLSVLLDRKSQHMQCPLYGPSSTRTAGGCRQMNSSLRNSVS